MTTNHSRNYISISQQEAMRRLAEETGYILLDVRRPDEFETGHIPGAILLPNEDIGFVEPTELPDKNQTIFLYCRSGNRSKMAAQKLSRLGYNNLVEIGGVNTWPGTLVR